MKEIKFDDNSIFKLPKEWEDVYEYYYGNKDISDRLIFVTNKYYENKAIPSKFDGIRNENIEDKDYDNPDFYFEHWGENVKKFRFGGDKDYTIVPNPPTKTMICEMLLYQRMRMGLLQKLFKKAGSKVKVVTPKQFIEIGGEKKI